MRHFHTPGISIAVINDFQVEWAKGYGLADAKAQTHVTTHTCFQAASISKLVTAVAVMRLAQDGVIDLDQDVNRYLTSWQIPAKDNWQPKVTIRQILSHSAGLSVHGFPGYHALLRCLPCPRFCAATHPRTRPR